MEWMCFFILFVFFVYGAAENTPEIEWLGMVDDLEYGSKFEGDMDLNDDQLAEIFHFRNAKIEEKYRWPKAMIAYKFSPNHTAEENALIVRAMGEIEKVSCARFVQRTNETDYVQIKAENDGCYSSVGRQGGKQGLNLKKAVRLGIGCFRIGVIIHELLHTLGFYHMQSVPDRDNYVKIHWENIKPNKTHNFKSYNTSFFDSFNLTYDFKSIMHYGPHAFAMDIDSPTFTTNIDDWRTMEDMGQRKNMSSIDIIKLNMFYHCDATKKNHGIQLRAQILSVMLITIHSIFIVRNV